MFMADVRIQRNSSQAQMNLKDLQSSGGIWKRHRDDPVKAPRSQQCFVQHLGSVSGGHHYNRTTRLASHKAIHARQQLVQRRLCLLVSSPHPHEVVRSGTQSIDLIDKDNARRHLPSPLEELANSSCTAPHKQLHKLSGRRIEERNAGLCCSCPRQQRLAGPRRSGKKYASWNTGTKCRVPAGRAQHLHNFLDLEFGSVDAGNVSEASDQRLRAFGLLGLHDFLARISPALPSAAGHAAHHGPDHAKVHHQEQAADHELWKAACTLGYDLHLRLPKC
mmetsp:Transcript_16767/g.39819  ORF Transcript_16767/g.39819 Transcript_16767/m.39819 type:complete len:277 (+) Transcript_16767:227-1057(+)